MAQVLALPKGALLVGDYQIDRVLGAGGFGITYLGRDLSLARAIAIKEYFPADSALREGGCDVDFRSEGQQSEFNVGLERFIEEAQALAQFDHRNIARVYRYFRANNTAYMVLHYEEGLSFKAWCQRLDRLPTQAELDAIISPLLDALETLHAANFLHRDIAPDNIIIRPDGSPVLIDFGSARREVAARSQTLSAVIKPGYSPVEQYSAQTSQQGPWTDIYALGATLYHAVMRTRPDDAPSRLSGAQIAPARSATAGDYRPGFLAAIDHALALGVGDRPASISAWRTELLGPPRAPKVFAAAAAATAPSGGHSPRAASARPTPNATRPVGPGGGVRQHNAGSAAAGQAGAPAQGSPQVSPPISPQTPPPAGAPVAKGAVTPAQTRKIETQTTPELVWRPKPKPQPVAKARADSAPAGGSGESGAGLLDQLAARDEDGTATPGATMTFDRPLTQSEQGAGAGRATGVGAAAGAAAAKGQAARPAAGAQRLDTYGIPIPPGVNARNSRTAHGGGIGTWMKGIGARLGGAARGGGGAVAAAGAGAAAGVGAAGLRVREGVGTAGDDLADWWGGIKDRHSAARQKRQRDRAARKEAAVAARQERARAAEAAAQDGSGDEAKTRRISPKPETAGPVAKRAMDQRKAGTAARPAGPSLLTRARGWWSRAVTGWRLPSIRPVNVLAFAVRCALIVGIMTVVVTAPTWMRDLEVKTARLGETPPPPRVTRIGLNRTLTGHRAGVTQVVPLLSGVATNAASTLGFASADTRGNLLIWRIEARRSPTGKADARYGFDIAQPVQLGTVADPVTSMAANRLSIATGSKGGVVQFWDAAGERKVRTLADGASSVTALAFMGSSRSLAAGYEDGRGQVINTRRGRRRTMGRDSDAIAALTWSPLRKQLISGGTDGAVRLWRKSSTSKVARTFYSHTSDVTALSVSSDGRVLATGGKDQQLKLWDPTEASTAPVLGGHDGPITALALSPDARLLASAGTDAKIKLWDVTERRVIQELVGSTGAVRALAFVRGGDQLISAGDDQRVRVWNTTIVGAVPVPPTADAAGGTGLRTDRLVEGENFTLRTRVSQGPALDEDVSAPVITLRDLTAE